MFWGRVPPLTLQIPIRILSILVVEGTHGLLSQSVSFSLIDVGRVSSAYKGSSTAIRHRHTKSINNKNTTQFNNSSRGGGGWGSGRAACRRARHTPERMADNAPNLHY
eukprot:1160632-Pelagomonas_calceolata.AAC.1